MDDDSFDFGDNESTDLVTSVVKIDSMKEGYNAREMRRIRNSASFRAGRILVSSIVRPWLLIFLPIRLMYLGYCLGMERLGKRPLPYVSKEYENIEQTSEDCVVFFPTNGVGFGHFTRMYALAKRWKKHSPSTELVFFTTMPTLHILYSEGFPTYHIAGRKKFKNMTALEWNTMLEEQLSLVFTQHKPSLFIFDGAFPYRGMLNAVSSFQGIKNVWIRRGMFKKGSNIPVDSIQHFDIIVRPEDSIPASLDEISHEVETLSVPPIVLLNEEELLSRKDARLRLMLPEKGPVVYVQLGAGRINDINSEVRLTIDSLLSQGVSVVLGESMLGERLPVELEGVFLLRDYPNSMFFNAFDASIQAGGYNSYHEVRKFGLPTIFYPNMNTGMDDQLARCKQAEIEGWGIVVESRNEQTIPAAVTRLLKLERRGTIPQDDGAFELYQAINL
jgi:hypothetical protein